MARTSGGKGIKLSFDCRVCHGALSPVLSLGQHPYADSFYPDRLSAENAPTFELECSWCEVCGLLQLSHDTMPEERYNGVDYSYTSSNSAFSRKHWSSLSDEIIELLPDAKLVLEIGSNDGFLLSKLQGHGLQVMGIDASQRMCDIARSNGIETICKVFDSSTMENLPTNFDLVIANNVFNHSNDPMDFLKGVSAILAESGTFVFEVPATEAMVQSGRYDQIYLEHVTYWTLESLIGALARAGLSLVRTDYVNYHGGSIRGFARHTAGSSLGTDLGLMEKWHFNKLGLNELRHFSDKLSSEKQLTRAALDRLWEGGRRRLAGVGAAAKANTAINYLGLGDFLDFVTDTSVEKLGKFTPLSGLQILDDFALKEREIDEALILAWNISTDLESSLKKIRPEMKVRTL